MVAPMVGLMDSQWAGTMAAQMVDRMADLLAMNLAAWRAERKGWPKVESMAERMERPWVGWRGQKRAAWLVVHWGFHWVERMAVQWEPSMVETKDSMKVASMAGQMASQLAVRMADLMETQSAVWKEWQLVELMVVQRALHLVGMKDNLSVE